ncbi:MAG: choice-of-anchor D domain-containing protein [Caldimonas sp.]
MGGANPGDFNFNLTGCPVGSGSCGIIAAFAPQAGASGQRSATVTVTNDAYGSPFVLALSGTVATGAALQATPATIDYGNVSVTAGSQLPLTLQNTGSGTLTISALTFAPGDYASVAGGSCGALPIVLNAQAQCSISVQFRPAQAGSRNGTLTLTDSAAGSPHTVALAGVGADPMGPQLVVNPPKSATFGAVQVGTTFNVPALFGLRNSGAQTATLSLAVPAEFPIATQFTTCGTTLAAGAGCFLSFGFAPSGVGPRSGTVAITTNAPGSPVQIALAGEGIVIPLVTPSPQRLNFGSVGVSITSPARTITIPNTGNGPLNIAAVSATGPFLVTNRCAATLAAGASCTIDVQATPMATGLAGGLLTITDDSPGNTHGVSLSVEGVNGPAVQVTPSGLDFGRQAVGAGSAPRSVTITNTGNALASLSGVATNGDFVQTTDCGSTLAVGASCTASVSFRPTLVSDPIGLVGLLTVGGSFNGNPVRVSMAGIGSAAAGAATRTTLTLSATTATAGQAVTLTAGVASTAAGTPSGTVTFFEGAMSLGTGTVAAGQTSVATSALAVGTHAITAQYGGDSVFAASISAAVSIRIDATAATPDFTLATTLASLSVAAGQNASTILTVAPSNGFQQAVTFACAGLPAGAACSFAPASVTPAGTPVTTQLTISTSADAVISFAPVGGFGGPPVPGPVGAVMFASLGVIALRGRASARTSRHGLLHWLAVLGAWGLLSVVSACGGASDGSGVGAAGGGTPAGTSTVTVTATSGAGQPSHAVALDVTVTR